MGNIRKGISEDIFEKVLNDCINKAEGVSDDDWEDIVERYDLDCHRDVIRKGFSSPIGGYPVYKFMKSKLESKIEDNEALNELEMKRLEIEKERKKLQATKIEYNRNLKLESRFELFYENIKEAIETLEIPEFEDLNIAENEKAYVLNFSDIHYASTFVSVNNEYSREICHKRFNIMAEKTIRFIAKNNINKLMVINNSDSIQGILRISDIRLNDIPVVESVVEVSQLLAKFLNKLSKYVEVEYIHVPMANHSQTRPLGTKASEMVAEDMEKIIINYVADLCANNERIYVHRKYKSDNVQFKIFDFECIALHGHQIRNIRNSLRDLSQLHRKWYSFVFLGHYHNSMNYTANEQETYNAEILVAPSIVGSCQYSDKLMVGGKAMAKIYGFDRVEGLVETTNLILN